MVRVKMGVKVDQDIWNEFRELVKEKYGQTRGVLGSELDKALENHIKQQDTSTSSTSNDVFQNRVPLIDEPAYTHTHATPSKYDYMLLNFEKTFSDSLEISKKELEEFIINTEDISHPTPIKQRVKVLEGKGLINQVSDGIYENVLVSELSQNSSKITEDSYNSLVSYFKENLNSGKIKKDKILDLPDDIQKLLFDIDPDKFKDFVE